jgi:bacterioferritin
MVRDNKHAPPYPKPRVMKPNPFYATLLLEDYAGATSEFTAISQFIYHSVVSLEQEDLHKLEKTIAMEEMHHLDLLAQTIALLGVDPKFRTLTDNIASYWKCSYVYYGRSITDRLSADIAAERSAINQYRHHLRLIEDPYIKELLERIIWDEEQHLKLFQQMAVKYSYHHSE